MNHIKTFSLFESNTIPDDIPDDIRQDIMDMALELKDEGYNVTYNWDKSSRVNRSNLNYWGKSHSCISITKGAYEKIYYGHIKDFCERIKSFLEEEGYDTVIMLHTKDSQYIDIEDTKVNWGPFNDVMTMSTHYRIEINKNNETHKKL
jgi:hypothetical protein